MIFLSQDSCSDLIGSDFLLLLKDLLADTKVLVLLIIVHFDELGDGVEDVSVEPSLLRCRQLVIKFIICRVRFIWSLFRHFFTHAVTVTLCLIKLSVSCIFALISSLFLFTYCGKHVFQVSETMTSFL